MVPRRSAPGVMAEDEKKAERKRLLLDENGRFKKGNPGGPGRPKGSGGVRKLLDEAFGADRKQEAIQKYVESVLSGDKDMLRDFMDRRFGKSKPMSNALAVELPDISTSKGASDALRILAQAAVDGEDSDQINAVAKMVIAALETGEWADVKARIDDLEKGKN